MRLLTAVLVALTATAVASAQPFEGRTRLAAFHSAVLDTRDAERDIIDQTNAFRADNGLSSVVPNAILTAEARAFASFLAGAAVFSHTADGRTPSERAAVAGYRSCALAENIARIQGLQGERGRQGVTADSLADRFVTGWERSPGHRRNMLDADVTETGVGVVAAPGADIFASVQVFGRPESMRYSFRIENLSGASVGYAFDGRAQRLDPRTSVMYTACASALLSFDPRVVRGADQPLRAEGDAVYRLRSSPGGVILLEILRDGAGSAPSRRS